MRRHRPEAEPTPAAVSIGPTRVHLDPSGPSGASDAVEAAWDALGCVVDPELCLDVVSLGLVYDVRDVDGSVVVDMTLTTPGCPASESLPEMARSAVAGAVGPGTAVDVRVVWEPPWDPSMIDTAARSRAFR